MNKELIYKIEENLKNVTLNGGEGYFQSIAIDNLIIDEENGEEKFQKEVDKDIEFGEDWKKLTAYLQENKIDWFAFPFMDDKGICYLIPCLLMLEDKENLCLLFSDYIFKNQKEIWTDFLTDKQRATIIQVFEYWNQQHIDELLSYGVAKEFALLENQKTAIFKVLGMMNSKTRKSP